MTDDLIPADALRDLVVRDATRLPGGLLPANLMVLEGTPLVCLLDMSAVALRAPFFDQDVERCLSASEPAARAVVDLATFADYTRRAATLAPSGLQFHVSRCGSTLVSQMLASLARVRVVSEPEIVNDVLLLPDAVLDTRERRRLLELVIRGLGTQPRTGGCTHYFIKFSSWNVLALSTLRSLFPGVPWVFQYRDPTEIMVSVLAGATGWMRARNAPGPLLRFMGFDDAASAAMDDIEYAARMLGRFFECALEADGAERALLAYPQLPDALPDLARAHLGLEISDEERTAMLAVSKLDAKGGGSFSADSDRKRAVADERVKNAAGRWAQPGFRALEAERVGSEPG